MDWVDLGHPCPVCVLVERHLHSRNEDGTLGIAVKLQTEEE